MFNALMMFYYSVNLEEHLDQYEHWANRYEELPLYYMGFHGPMETIAVMEVRQVTVLHACITPIVHSYTNNFFFYF